MQIAEDRTGRKTHIRKADNSNQYLCPECREKVILRKGKVRIPHFSHKRKTVCEKKYAHKMTEWHINWQLQFLQEYREVVLTKDGLTHRADICIDNLVIELQNSPLKNDEFTQRNDFYISCGKKVIWIFNETEETEKDFSSIQYEGQMYGWRKALPKWNIGSFPFSNENIELYIQSEPTATNTMDTPLKRLLQEKAGKYQWKEVPLKEILKIQT